MYILFEMVYAKSVAKIGNKVKYKRQTISG